MIMFKYTESSINVYQTEANKFHLDNLLKYTKSQCIKILHPVHGFYYRFQFHGLSNIVGLKF